jgi:4-amino-4-deoxy-L-arabinose transferase-like glycosyltransferase
LDSSGEPQSRLHTLLYALPAAIGCLFFLLAGLLFLPQIGIENDEALFAGSFLKPYGEAYTVRIGHSRIPLMLMSYIGTIKGWLYRPLMSIFGTGLTVLRLPMLLAGVASVWLFFRLLQRIAGLRAAIIGCTLLAADATYLLTVCFDWGPVALQHLLLVAGLLLLVRFYQLGRLSALFWGCCLLGLGMWDKALAVWMLGGIGVAVLMVLPHRLWALLSGRRIAVASLGFLLGVLPLLIYNMENQWATFVGNVSRDTSDIPGKAHLLMETAKGDGLFGWMFDEQWQTPTPHRPSGVIQQTSAEITSVVGHPRRHLLFYAFLLALALTPFARGEALRAIFFALIAMAVAWVQMATNASTGGSIHHSILLWPFPQIVVAVSFAAASRRLGRAGIPVVAAAAAAMFASGVLVANEYYYVSYSFGGAPAWSDAILPLSDFMKGAGSATVYCVDWGMLDPLRYLNHGKLKLAGGSDPISKKELTPADREAVLRMLADPGAIYVAHTKDFENFQGTNQHLQAFAAAEGYRRDMLAVISDRYGRPAFEVYRMSPPSSDSALPGWPRPLADARGSVTPTFPSRDREGVVALVSPGPLADARGSVTPIFPRRDREGVVALISPGPLADARGSVTPHLSEPRP